MQRYENTHAGTENVSRAIANYLIGNLIASYVDYLPIRYRKPYQDFRKVFSGVESDQARYKTAFLRAPPLFFWLMRLISTALKIHF